MRWIAVAVLMSAACMAGAAESTPETYSAQFFETLIKGDGAKAVDDFFGANPLIKGREPQLQMLKTQLSGVLQIYGPASGAELIIKEEFSSSLERRVYITKHDFHPVTWEMYFYKGKSGWLADQLQFADQYQFLVRKK